jgi:prepilin-type processing-associated H-X9-DG protein
MFTDAAFLEGVQGQVVLIEYSFAEAPQFLSSGPSPTAVGQAQPSIHFRHGGRVSVVWCDGHVSSEPMTFSYGSVNSASHLGWFGPADNSLFDPY